jgi:glycosyltransferase involved in cell wall biosynthesis
MVVRVNPPDFDGPIKEYNKSARPKAACRTRWRLIWTPILTTAPQNGFYLHGRCAALKITHFSTWDTAGGAARAAYRLHQSLLALGQNSRMAALIKSSRDDTVTQFSPSMQWPVRVQRGLRRRYLERTAARLNSLPAGATIFTDDRSQYTSEPASMAGSSDVINLHWVAGFIDHTHFFRALPPNLPVVWTLHDMNAFTGGCHYSFDCDAFTRSCGSCPQLSSQRGDDLSSRVWLRKHRAYESQASSRIQFVTPSRWLAAEVRRSGLLNSSPVSVIPYSLDTEKFRPRDCTSARQRFGIPAEAKVVLFVADWAAEKRKGLSLLFDALRKLAHINDLCIVMLGRKAAGLQPDARCIQLEFIEDEEAMSYLYSAADIFVIPSVQDNFPNTALEALACGVPTVAFHVGGVPEIVANGCTGVTVRPGDSEALARAIEDLLADPGRRASLSRESRRVALEEFSLEIQARFYLELYESLVF